MRKCLFEVFQVLSKAFILYEGSKETIKIVMGTLMLAFKLWELLSKMTSTQVECQS